MVSLMLLQSAAWITFLANLRMAKVLQQLADVEIANYFVDLLLHSCYLLSGRGFNQNWPLVQPTSSKLHM